MIMDASYLCWRLMRTGALLLVAGSPALSAQTPPLTLVSTAWSPFTNEPGRPRFALDLLRSMITDGTYHRLLHLDWIQADIDGDGVPEYVPLNDQAGPNEPLRIYSLFSNPEPTYGGVEVKPGFYIGGSTYSDWASVPDTYKVGSSSANPPDASRSTASIFKFTW